MIYKYEEWFDIESGTIDIFETVITSTSYEYLENFLSFMLFAGQSGNSVSHGMEVFWCVIYCGY